MARFASSDNEDYQLISMDNEKLKKTLLYHVVPGATLTTKRIKELAKKAPGKAFVMTSKEGEKLSATVEGDRLFINGAAAAGTPDVQGGKTMLIAVGDVIVPPTLGGKVPTKKVDGKEVPVDPKAVSGAAAAGAPVAAAAALAVPALLALLV